MSIAAGKNLYEMDCASCHGSDENKPTPVGRGMLPRSVALDSATLLEVTERSLWAGIAQLVEGGRLHEVGRAVQDVAEAAGFSVVREYVGHGIGTAMHEEPAVPNYWPGTPGALLKTGMVFAVEPMVNAGSPRTRQLEDGWSVVTSDGRLSAHFEHTIAVTDEGPEVLTLA